ncbi:hypothetical protein ACIQUO_17065 [Streptomyces albogriseolus]|uniref:hypothetical protein n=1 Tax=Streptomyces TaxID=1883 RepID=UPI00142F4D17|nr:hypothetical protein [Streptomyces sp. 2BBP-J2]NIL49362.1 hypothetical protein [Streptomyces sp. 2BBP-J2]
MVRSPGTGPPSADTTHARPACCSGAGFDPELRAAEERGEVVLVDLHRLYHGS